MAGGVLLVNRSHNNASARAASTPPKPLTVVTTAPTGTSVAGGSAITV